MMEKSIWLKTDEMSLTLQIVPETFNSNIDFGSHYHPNPL